LERGRRGFGPDRIDDHAEGIVSEVLEWVEASDWEDDVAGIED
jgi:hypothetical protein